MTPSATNQVELTMKILIKGMLIGLLAAAGATAVQAADLSGAGSSFIYPVFAKWADTYKKESGIGLNYQSIGSGGGI